jgi:hypothetical protein
MRKLIFIFILSFLTLLTTHAVANSDKSELILGSWKDEDSKMEYFRDGTFISHADTGKKYTGTWSIEGNTLRFQFISPVRGLNVYTIMEMTDSTYKIKLNHADRRTANARRIEPLKQVPVYTTKNSRTYHTRNCSKLNSNDLIEFKSSQEAGNSGALPCIYCKPLAVKKTLKPLHQPMELKSLEIEAQTQETKEISKEVIERVKSFSIQVQKVYPEFFSGMILSEEKKGLEIVEVMSGSPGFVAGLKNGDIILEIEGKKINSLPDNIKNKKDEALLVILRNDVEYDVTMKAKSIPIYQDGKEENNQKKQSVGARSSTQIKVDTNSDKGVYVGELKNGARHGYGTYTWANSNKKKYTGEWRDGKRYDTRIDESTSTNREVKAQTTNFENQEEVISLTPFSGKVFRTEDDRSSINIVSKKELELSINGTTYLCEYKEKDNTLRVVLTILGSAQVLYFQRAEYGIIGNDNTKFLSPKYYAEAKERKRLAREEQIRKQLEQEQEQELQKRQAEEARRAEAARISKLIQDSKKHSAVLGEWVAQTSGWGKKRPQKVVLTEAGMDVYQLWDNNKVKHFYFVYYWRLFTPDWAYYQIKNHNGSGGYISATFLFANEKETDEFHNAYFTALNQCAERYPEAFRLYKHK